MAISISQDTSQKEEVLSYAVFAIIFVMLISFNYLIRRVTSLNLLFFILLIAYMIITNLVNKNTDEGRRIDVSFLQILSVLHVVDSWLQKSIILLVSVLMEFIFRSDIFHHDKIPLLVILPTFFAILYMNQRKNKLLFYDYFYI